MASWDDADDSTIFGTSQRNHTGDDDAPAADNWEDLLKEDDDDDDFLGDANLKNRNAPNKAISKTPIKDSGSSLKRVEEMLSDPLAERLRKTKLTEESERNLAADLFEGCQRPEGAENFLTGQKKRGMKNVKQTPSPSSSATQLDPFANMKLRTQAECENLANRMCRNIMESNVKSFGWLRMLDIILKECTPKMDKKDLTTLRNKIDASLLQRDIEKNEKVEKKKKPNDAGSKMKRYMDELDMMYGDLSDENEDYSDDYDYGVYTNVKTVKETVEEPTSECMTGLALPSSDSGTPSKIIEKEELTSHKETYVSTSAKDHVMRPDDEEDDIPDFFKEFV